VNTIIRIAKVAVIVLLLGYGLPAQQQETVQDEEMTVAHFEDMRYPPLARVARSQGVVVVKVTLDKEGNVVTSTAISGAKYLIPDCLENAKKWRFRPNARNIAVIVYSFRLSQGLCNTLTSQFNFWGPNFASISTCEQPVQH